MQAGRLRHRITVQENTPTQNEIGEWVDAWTDYATVWASVEPARGSQYYQAKQLDSKVDGTIIMRYRDDIEPTMRVIHDGRTLKIVSLLTVKERKRELHIMYSEALD
jgi:SPP1 family predicted phage head-tail adaptor